MILKKKTDESHSSSDPESHQQLSQTPDTTVPQSWMNVRRWACNVGYLSVTVLNKAVYKADSRPCFPFSISMKPTQWQLSLYLPASLSLSLSVFFTFLEHPVLSVLVFLHLPSAKSSSCTRSVSVHEHVDMHRFSTYTCSGDQLSKYTQCCFVCLPSRTQVGHYLLANVLTRRSACSVYCPVPLLCGVHEPDSSY